MKVGLITYHSAYNFGSVLQAYATQEAIKRIVGECEIINYRITEQRRVYSIFKIEYNKKFIKSLVKNVLALYNLKSKIEREKKYENTINSLFNLTQECKTPDEVKSIWNKYDLIVSGSDQIWNKHSNELENSDWEFMNPYLLHGYRGKKISYASSLTNMSIDEIKKIYDDLNEFDDISIREKETTELINNEFNLKAKNVLDPTFLLNNDEWIKEFNLKKEYSEEKYILFYALGKSKDINGELMKLKKYADNKKLKIKVIAPLSYLKKIKGIDYLLDVDPVDFLKLIYNASIIITDSYHGTILSVNLHCNIFSICKGNPSDFRKTDILKKLDLEDRIISNVEQFVKFENSKIDYSKVEFKLYKYRKESLKYLEDALGGN